MSCKNNAGKMCVHYVKYLLTIFFLSFIPLCNTFYWIQGRSGKGKITLMYEFYCVFFSLLSVVIFDHWSILTIWIIAFVWLTVMRRRILVILSFLWAYKFLLCMKKRWKVGQRGFFLNYYCVDARKWWSMAENEVLKGFKRQFSDSFNL